MTLVLAITSAESIWMLVDRRLTRGRSVVSDLAQKALVFEHETGKAIFAYAGLGATGAGTEPSAWMRGVLRGPEMTFDQSLNAIARTMQEQLPRHLRTMKSVTPAHQVIVPAFVNGVPKLFYLQVSLQGPARSPSFFWTQYVTGESGNKVPPRFAAGGSGAQNLPSFLTWARPALRLVKEFGKKRVKAEVVSQFLANLNFEVHQREPSVGPNCLVIWRDRTQGGGHHNYFGTKLSSDTPSIPTIVKGLDVSAMAEAMVAHHRSQAALGKTELSDFLMDPDDLDKVVQGVASTRNEQLN